MVYYVCMMKSTLSIISGISSFVLKNVEGQENIPATGGFLFAANHTNHFDPAALFAASYPKTLREIHFLAKHNLMLWKILGDWGAKKLYAIRINPEHKEKSLDQALEVLISGHIIGIYPEGKCNTQHHLIQGRSGAALLARWTGLPVIPVGISGGPPARRGLGLASDILFRFPHSVTVRFGKPLVFDKPDKKYLPQEMLDSTTREIMKAVGDLCGKPYPH